MSVIADSDMTINSAIAVANWFIEQNQIDPSALTHLKIQKMLYFAQGWHLAHLDIPLFEDPIEAWKYGPVVRSVYRALNSYQDNIITAPIMGYVLKDLDYTPLGTPQFSSLNNNSIDFMRWIWDSYSKMEAWKLVSISHAKNSPWDKVANPRTTRSAATDNELFGEYYDLVIPVELMKSYFKSLLARTRRYA
ncbi:MAG: DUF4065 domain-containing protein [Deltaproteobacteria bacterium]|jgi:uncharacterized phage-associated protein|nr:DUF4065 domain-containing protein [Deltaproteobacteria bacterium]